MSRAVLSGVDRLRDPAAWPTGDGGGSQPAAKEAARFLDNPHARVLNVNGCNLTGLPPELGDLSDLTTFMCRNNQIRELSPAALRGPALGVLMCDGNPLEEPWAGLLRTEVHSEQEQDALVLEYEPAENPDLDESGMLFRDRVLQIEEIFGVSLRANLASGICNQDAILAHARSSGRLTKAARA